VLVEHDVIGFYISVANIVADQPIDSWGDSPNQG
jgi:hypothetical protein